MLQKSDRADGLAIGDSIEWSGAGLHFLVEDSQLAQAAARGDCSQLVRQHAVPPQMLDALAVFALDRNDLSDQLRGRKECDPRWLRALAREAKKRSLIEEVPDANVEILVEARDGLEVQHVREDAALLCPSPFAEKRAELARLWPQGIEFPASQDIWFSLPAPLRGSGLMVSAWNPSAKRARFWLDGETFEANVESLPRGFARSERGVWIQCAEAVLIGDQVIPSHSTLLPLVGDWLPILSPSKFRGTRWVADRIGWQHLDGKQPAREHAWGHEVRRVMVAGDALWITSDDGLFRAAPEGVTQKFDRDCFGLSLDPLYLGHRDSLIAGLKKFPVGHLVFDIAPVKNGVVAIGFSQWTWLDRDGNLRMQSRDRRDTGFARLPDGSFACSAGEELLVLAPDGELRCKLLMPYDGQIVGATATHFLYGPISGGVARFSPDALYAISGDGEICERNPDATRPVHVRESVLQTKGGSLTRWRPRPPNGRIHSLVNTTRREERALSIVKWETVNPRDDWPEPGLLVDGQELIADGCTYGGTTGVAASEAVIVDGGGVAVLERCKLVNDGGGKLRRGSTAILIDCEGNENFSLEPDCQLAIVKSNSARSS